MLERPGPWLSVAFLSRQFQDALLGLAKLAEATLEQLNSLLIFRQRLFQPDFSLFQLAHDALELGERVFEFGTFGRRLAHEIHSQAHWRATRTVGLFLLTARRQSASPPG